MEEETEGEIPNKGSWDGARNEDARDGLGEKDDLLGIPFIRDSLETLSLPGERMEGEVGKEEVEEVVEEVA